MYKMVTAPRHSYACINWLWPFRILAAMTSPLMQLKGNRAHSHWWFRSSQIVVLPKNPFFVPWRENRAKKISANIIAELVLLTNFHAAPPPWQLRLWPRCRLGRHKTHFPALRMSNTWYRISVKISRLTSLLYATKIMSDGNVIAKILNRVYTVVK
jgi:hypothetical protein